MPDSKGRGPWKLTTPNAVADALDWLRWRTEGSALLLVAIGRNHICFARQPDVDPLDAIQFLEDELATIKAAMLEADAQPTQKNKGSKHRRIY